MEQENPQNTLNPQEEPIEPAMYQSRRQAEANPEPDEPNDTFLSNITKTNSFFD